MAARSGQDHVYFSVGSQYSRFHGRRPSTQANWGFTMPKKKRQAQGAAMQQPAPKKMQKGRPKTSASADAKQGSSTQPKKKSRAGQREPSSVFFPVVVVSTTGGTPLRSSTGVLHHLVYGKVGQVPYTCAFLYAYV